MLGCAHDMDVSPRSTCPHDVSACWLVSRRQACGCRIKGPKNHPMWSDSDGWVSFVEWVGVASLRCSREHVFDARGLVVGFALCSAKSRFHCIATLSSHIGGDPTPLGSPGRHVKSLVPVRRIFICPCAFISATVASLVTLGGPAERARAILLCLDSCDADTPIRGVHLRRRGVAHNSEQQRNNPGNE